MNCKKNFFLLSKAYERKIVKEELYNHCKMWHLGIVDEE